MPAKLLYRDPQGKQAEYEIPAQGCYLGRGTDCAIRTDDAMVSRKNCRISMMSGKWVVEDLGSSNGTFINEKKITKATLNHNDVVRCGTLQVRFVEAVKGATGKKKKEELSSSVEVDPALTGGAAMPEAKVADVEKERDDLAARLREVSAELDRTKVKLEREEEELATLRGEVAPLREQASEALRQKASQDEELHAHVRVGEELRRELAEMRKEYATARARSDELTEEVATRDRQLERALDEVQRGKEMAEELRKALADVQKTKDEGWKELNNRVGELDHLREVISEQERLLEERRVGLISFESSMKEVRADKEAQLRELIQMRSERDELKDKVARMQGHIEAIEEEERRAARGGDGGGGGADDAARMQAELRDARIELKKNEAERTRLQERVEQAEEERKKLVDRVAQLDVERATLSQDKMKADSARSKAEELRLKIEGAERRSEEERKKATEARDAALTTGDGYRRDLDRAKKKITELEEELAKKAKAATAPAMATAQMAATTGAFEVPPEARILQLEEELAKLGTELALAQAAGSDMPSESTAVGGDAARILQIKERAEAAAVGINDLLSELRTSVVAAETIDDAAQIVRDNIEQAKTLLRSLTDAMK